MITQLFASVAVFTTIDVARFTVPALKSRNTRCDTAALNTPDRFSVKSPSNWSRSCANLSIPVMSWIARGVAKSKLVQSLRTSTTVVPSDFVMFIVVQPTPEALLIGPTFFLFPGQTMSCRTRYNRHVIKGSRHTEETKKKVSESKRHEKNRAPLQPRLCACGCGEYAAVDERRNRVSTFVCGHNSKIAPPMKGKVHTAEAKTKLAMYTGERASSFKHGWSGTPTYVSWSAMHSRCRDLSNGSYRYYGGRGISVCDRWATFEAFLEDMGERPSRDYEIDRRDPNGNYEPGNCRWLTKAENNARRRDPGGWIVRRARELRG